MISILLQFAPCWRRSQGHNPSNAVSRSRKPGR